MKRIVLVHPQWGVFLGQCLGMGFFSSMDCGGQQSAVSFPDEPAARQFVASWSSMNNPDDYRYVPAAEGHFATIEELDAAGLAEFTGQMKEERLRYMQPAGRA